MMMILITLRPCTILPPFLSSALPANTRSSVFFHLNCAGKIVLPPNIDQSRLPIHTVQTVFPHALRFICLPERVHSTAKEKTIESNAHGLDGLEGWDRGDRWEVSTALPRIVAPGEGVDSVKRQAFRQPDDIVSIPAVFTSTSGFAMPAIRRPRRGQIKSSLNILPSLRNDYS
jgi:hypothetical protein